RAGVLARPPLAPPLPDPRGVSGGTRLAGGESARPVPAGGDPDGGTDRRGDDLDRLGLLAPRQPHRFPGCPVRGDLLCALGPSPPRLPVPAGPRGLAAVGLLPRHRIRAGSGSGLRPDGVVRPGHPVAGPHRRAGTTAAATSRPGRGHSPPTLPRTSR